MRRPTRRETVLAVVPAAFVAAILLWFPSGESPGPVPEGGSADALGSVSLGAPVSFAISGDASGAMAPGSTVPLNLSLDNPHDSDLEVEAITVSVRDVDAPRADADRPCGLADFEVRQIPGPVVLSLGRQRTQDLSDVGLARRHWPAVVMLDRPVNQDGCKGAVLTLDYEATGVRVRR